MQFRFPKHIVALLSIVASRNFANADNSLLSVIPEDSCIDLVTGSDGIVLGQVCTEVAGDDVLVTFNMSSVAEDCCIKETHICNMPPMVANIEEDGCLKTVPFSVIDVFGFMCSEPCETFQFNGHATVICDSPLRGDNDEVPGDPLPNGAGQGNYGKDEFCYGAMYDVGLECGPCTTDVCTFTCEAPAEICGEAQGANGVNCYCSQSTEQEDFCWQDIGCFVPIFYLTTTPGVPCTSSDVGKAGTSCVPSTCCGDSLCLPTCNPSFGDKSLDVFAKQYDIPMDELKRAMECPVESCKLPSGDKLKFEYPTVGPV